MGSSRNLVLLFVLLFLILSSQVAPSNAQTTEHIDKKNGNAVHLPNSGGDAIVVPGPLRPIRPFCDPKVYGTCIPRGVLPPTRRRCNHANHCSPPGRAPKFTDAQFKDDFHN